jgi:hypothetical protein
LIFQDRRFQPLTHFSVFNCAVFCELAANLLHFGFELLSMCWGFDHGDGWFEIIWQPSLAIEEELNYSWLRERWFLSKKAFFRSWNAFIYTLSPVRPDKKKQEGSVTKEDPIVGCHATAS